MKLEFYYWGMMCPLTHECLEMLKAFQGKIDIHVYDVTNDPDLARQAMMFFPFLTVLNDKFRFYRPLSSKFLETVADGDLPIEKPFRPLLGTRQKEAKIQPITEENYHMASWCTSRGNCKGALLKTGMYRDIHEDIYGFMSTSGKELLGGAEFVPSLAVPYDIPKSKDTAFITCVYLSNERFDCKTAPLAKLEAYLSPRFRKALVISDETGVFPNGDRAFFLRNGYTDQKVIFEDEYCKLHLMSKDLA